MIYLRYSNNEHTPPIPTRLLVLHSHNRQIEKTENNSKHFIIYQLTMVMFLVEDGHVGLIEFEAVFQCTDSQLIDEHFPPARNLRD